MKKARIHIILLILVLFSLSACYHTNKVEQRGGYILVKNTIKNRNAYLPSDELEGFIQQSSLPGRLAPYIRPGIFFYENSLKGKETKFKLFQRKSFGKKPIILDTLLAQVSTDKLKIYLKNKGFYHANVTKEIKCKHNTASVIYHINSGEPCIVDKFEYNVPDTVMLAYILADAENGKLRKGMIYDTYFLDDERDRIASMLKNNSYFNFSLSDIYYVVDTMNAGYSATVELHTKKIKVNVPGSGDSTKKIQHPRFYINNIYITPNASIISNVEHYDTLAYSYLQSKADSVAKTLYILHNNDISLKPSFLLSCLKLAPGDAYNQLAANQTYKKLINQGIIGSANINMVVYNPDTLSPLEKQWIDCNIRLVRNKLFAFNIGSEGTNSAGRFGMGLNTSIQNRNLFRGAEVISLKLRTSAEIQGSLNNGSQNSEKYFLIFNTLEGGAEVSIDFPRILLPYHPKYNQNLHQGLTSVSAGIGFEYRPEYKRNISTAAWSYKWNQGERIKHVFTPIELNYVNISTSQAFQLHLDTLTDPQYKSQYTDHLLTMIRYSFILSNIGITKENDQFFLRLNAETSGNIPYLFDNIANNPVTSEGYYERFGVRYSQFIRFDADFRKYWKLKFGNTLVFRIMGGLALPYGNSVSIPFEKSFWLGGANDMRGWRLRSLGPGAYAASDKNYDKTGDILLQSSIEQRFPIYSFLLGSLFIDAGNVWLREKSEDFPNGEFKLSSFYKQIAMDLGVGFRFDFSFFIFRIDAAVPFYNPALTDKWFNTNDFRLRNAIWNFGIGYPF